MDAITQPLSRVAQAMQGFMRRKDARVLHVVTTGPLRLAVLEHIAAAEHYGANRSPFVVLEAPSEGNEDEWTTRAAELRDDYDDLRARLVRDESPIEMPALRTAPVVVKPALACFVLELRAALDGLRAPLAGLVVVLAPLWVRDPQRWAREVGALVAQSELASVRWVIVDLEDAVCEPVVRAFGKRIDTVDARVDDAAARAGMGEILAAMASAPRGAAGARLAGAAGPCVAPLPRRNKPESLTLALAPQATLPSAFTDGALMQRLHALILRAATAMRDGDAPGAARLQREGQVLCLEAGLLRESVVMELVLGGYALQGGAPVRALEVFRQARERAEAAGFAELAVQAQLAVGAALLAQRRTTDATVAYAEAGQLGATMGAPVLAIEGYRMAGQLLAADGKSETAASAWRRALEVAAQAAPLDRKASTAAYVARALASVCRKHQLMQQAVALEAQAEIIEGSEEMESRPVLVEASRPRCVAEMGEMR